MIKNKNILIARLKYINDKLDFNKICWVNPHEIRYCMKNMFDKWENYCRILEGDWDRSVKLFEDLLVYQAFEQRFKDGKKWEETKWYQHELNQLSNGRIKWNCRTKDDFDERLKHVDSLYYQIKRNGYKSKKMLSLFQRRFSKFDIMTILDEIAVVVGRDGQILFVDGHHRLSIAKLLDLPLVPVVIILRHKKWMDFRRELVFFIRNCQDGKLYQSFTHPDLQDIQFKHIGVPFNVIKDNLSFSQGNLLDMGANMGYFCHKFEVEGFDCYTTEENSRCLYFLKKLRKAENRTFKIIPESIFEYNKNQVLDFDVVLALNGLHRYLEKKDTFLNLIEFLKRLNVTELFLVTYKPDEYRNSKVYRNFSPDQFINFILENSCLIKAKYIGKTEDGRSIYKLT